MIDVTIVTHAGMPDGSPDDLMLSRALVAAGASSRCAVWNDPDVDWAATPVAIIRSTWDYHLEPAQWYRWLERTAPLTRLINPVALLRWNSDKTYLLELGAAGISIVPTMMMIDTDELNGLADACAGRGWKDIVIKPAIGASAIGARRFTGDAITRGGRLHGGELMRRGRIIVQPYQAAVETDRERSLVFIGGRFAHAFTKPPFHAGLDATRLRAYRPDSRELSLGERALAVLPVSPAVARVDMLPSADGPLVMELELIEPQLAFHLHAPAADTLAAVVFQN